MWICTKDHSFERDGGSSRVDTSSANYDERIFQEFKDSENVEKWLTKDDDGNNIHEGLFIYYDDASEFDPLDQLSTPDCGATTIYFWNKKEEEWEVV